MSYAPGPDEPSSLIFAEKTFLQGAFLNAVSYGCILILCSICLHLLWSLRNGAKRSYFFIVFTIVIFIIATLNTVSCAAFTQDSFISDRNYSGGPAGFENAFFYIPIDELGNVTFIISEWLCDALLLWRFYFIYVASGGPIWVIIGLPCLLYVATWVMGVLFIIQLSATSPWSTDSNINWTIPWFAMSLSYNIILTVAIAGRLFYFRQSIRSATKDSSFGNHYTSIAAMLIESAFLTSSFSLLCLVPFALGSSVAEIFLQALGQVQIIATLLIIYRVGIGRGWTESTTAALTTRTRDTEHMAGADNGIRQRQTIMFAPMQTQSESVTESDSAAFYSRSRSLADSRKLGASISTIGAAAIEMKEHGDESEK